jgi:hypothetical protein
MMALAVPDCRRLQLVRVVPRTGVEVIALRLRGVVRRPLPLDEHREQSESARTSFFRAAW